MRAWLLAIVGSVTVLTLAHSAQAQNLFVANQAGNTIREFSPAGEDLGDFATTGLAGPTGRAFDKSGNLYVSNIAGNTIREFSPTGEDLGDFATTGLSAPRGLAFDNRGQPLRRQQLGGWLWLDSEILSGGSRSGQLRPNHGIEHTSWHRLR